MGLKVVCDVSTGMLRRYWVKRSWAASWSGSAIKPSDTYCLISESWFSLNHLLQSQSFRNSFHKLSLSCCRGSGRCRHFVINQSKSGQFVVCGDTKGHDMISGLIEYYKTNPIQPFGEYLTSPSFEVRQNPHLKKSWRDTSKNEGLTGATISQELHEELYDIIQAGPALAVNIEKQQNPVQPPTRPARNSRTLEVSKAGDLLLTISDYLAFAELTLKTRLVLWNRKPHLCLGGTGTSIAASSKMRTRFCMPSSGSNLPEGCQGCNTSVRIISLRIIHGDMRDLQRSIRTKGGAVLRLYRALFTLRSHRWTARANLCRFWTTSVMESSLTGWVHSPTHHPDCPQNPWDESFAMTRPLRRATCTAAGTTWNT